LSNILDSEIYCLIEYYKMETTVTPLDYKTLYEQLLVSLNTINALYVELHKKVMETHPEIILNN
jgi:archaellum biogenesis protein FlaJ (TadC family)